VNANATSPSVRIKGRGRLAASCNPDNFYLLTVTFRQIVQADDVVFGRVELDLGLGLKGHVGVGFWISFQGGWMLLDALERQRISCRRGPRLETSIISPIGRMSFQTHPH
jgi:hypothetical protein